MNETVKATLSGLPKEFIEWLETLRHKNPLIGSNAGTNSNAVFVEIGKNLVVDKILEERENALHPKHIEKPITMGSELLGDITK